MVQWLEDFKTRFGEYEEAHTTILEVESALSLYKTTTDKIRVPLAVQKARDARKADGSVLEYGIQFTLDGFNRKVEKNYIFYNHIG